MSTTSTHLPSVVLGHPKKTGSSGEGEKGGRGEERYVVLHAEVSSFFSFVCFSLFDYAEKGADSGPDLIFLILISDQTGNLIFIFSFIFCLVVSPLPSPSLAGPDE